jgi:flavin reductase (DIM6/NTAB) family NADH-FMN oxidoreductase RutF
MLTINPKEVPVVELHGHLLSAIAPRPIAFASTVDKDGNVNLSPFSFFNVFGANPATLIFSPARRVRDNTTKHTLENIYETSEVVINIVNYDMVQQMSLASTEYGQGINEFVKAGFTQVKSQKVTPPIVGEAPVSFECKVTKVIETGTEGGAGNLIICKVLLMHIKEEILGTDGKIDPQKIDLVARMGANWYCRASGEAVFEIKKPIRNKGIGIDQLPESIRNSTVLTGNSLAQLANVEAIPSTDLLKNIELGTIEISKENFHQVAQEFLNKREVNKAWKVLLMNN